MKKILIPAAALLALSLSIAACGKTEEHTHSWVAESTTATCGEKGVTSYACGCGETKTEDTAASGNHKYDSDVCTVCGYINFAELTAEEAIARYGFYAEDRDFDGTYSAGDTVYFGSYPQNVITDSALISSMPSDGEWKDYGYYSDGAQSAYAYYKDVTAGGKRYRGVYFTDYRPYYSGLAAGASNSYIDDGGYETDTVYWFGYAPVRWNVLSYGGGNLFLASEYCLDAQPFQDVYESDGEELVIPGTEEYVNNWKYCSLRSFLNGEFYENAFNGLQQSLIQTVTLDNAATGYSATAESTRQDTRDRVFLPSYADLNNAAYGYSSKGSTRTRTYTDYSVIQGLRTSVESSTADGKPACSYMLRSAGVGSYGLCGVSKNGTVSYNTQAFSDESADGVAVNGDLGVLPVLYIRAGKAAQGGWEDFTYEYDDGGKAAQATCSVYVPASYVGGRKLPLITYIGDSSYTDATLAQYKTAQCTKAWITDEKMEASPAFFLVICGAPSASLAVSVIDCIVRDYGIDADRLYLTGQSMGGITDFLINDLYPDKFAATVYVDCQPGGEIHDEQYDSIMADAKFANQKFIYIASRKDELAAQGQDDVERALADAGISYGKLYGLDHKDTAALNAAIKAELDKGYEQYFFGFTQVTSSGNTAAEHMQSFQYGYSVDAIFYWLTAQHK